MQRKLNEEFIQEYSEEFSEKITSAFFNQKAKISGKELLNLTPSKQVNLFVLKILFRKWQEEMKKLESPYFNFQDAEVRKAMVQFMNILSQHIEVDSEHLKPMLEQAVADSLLLATDPGGYFALEFDDIDVPMISEKVTKPMLKYIRLYKNEVQDFFDGNIDMPQDEFVDAADDYFEDLDISATLTGELEKLSEIQPIREDELFDLPTNSEDEDEEVLIIDESLSQENQYSGEEGSFFDQQMDEDEEVETEENEDFFEESKDEKYVEEPQEEDEIVDKEISESAFHFTTNSPHERDYDSHDQDEEVSVRDVSGATANEGDSSSLEADKKYDDTDDEVSEDQNDEEVEESADESLNARYKAPSATVNDNFGKSEKQTIADQLEKRKVNSIMEAISVNHRYMFTKELFEGDREAFTRAIAELEAVESFDDAVEKLVHTHGKQYSWDMNSEEVKELLKVIFRRFR